MVGLDVAVEHGSAFGRIAVLGQADTPWQLLAIHPSPGHACHIEDWFARGSDLMVRYGSRPAIHLHFKLTSERYRTTNSKRVSADLMSG